MRRQNRLRGRVLGSRRAPVAARGRAATTPPTTAARRPTTAPRTVIAAPAEVTAPRVNRTGEAIGTGAPHQERNPSQHPELWVQDAGR